MRLPKIDDDPVARRGEELYEATIRAQVESRHQGKYIVIHVKTGEYEVDEDDLAAVKRAKARFGPDDLYTMRIGHSAGYRLGTTHR